MYLCGTTEPRSLSRKKIINILQRKPKLKARIETSKRTIDNHIHFQVESERVKNVIEKLAQGIAKFENSEIQFEEPYAISYKPIILMNDQETNDFFDNEELELLPEIGSRAFQRIMVDNEGVPRAYWKDVQENNFSYSIAHTPQELRVRMLIWNYLTGDVIWA